MKMSLIGVVADKDGRAKMRKETGMNIPMPRMNSPLHHEILARRGGVTFGGGLRQGLGWRDDFKLNDRHKEWDVVDKKN